MPVVLSPNASDRVKQAASILASYLGRISGAAFAVTTGGEAGLAVGLSTSFPSLELQSMFEPQDSLRREEYLLRSHAKGVWLIGATELAVEHAVWDFLYRLGHRQFFPGERWEVVPQINDLRVAIDTKQQPSFYSRAFSYDFGFWDYSKQPWEDWISRNRMRSGVVISAGHNYQAIIAANKKAFAQHPEYLGLVDGKRSSSKFCISNAGLRKLVVEYALEHFAKNPDADSVSLEPSDGGGWCECEACAKLGSISDRAVLLANEVAQATGLQFGQKLVGMLAYNLHSPPPQIRAQPNVVVRVTTHQTKGGFTHDELLDGWGGQGAAIGVSEAYCTFVWDYHLPGKQRGSDLAYLRRTIPHFYQKGARFIGGWTSDSWGPVGLGNYLVARLTWDVKEADCVEELVADFFQRAFGPVREPMEKFYRLIYRVQDEDRRPLLSEDLLGRMYRYLGEALQKADDTKLRARIADLVHYTHYVELYMAYTAAKGADRQKAFEELLRYTYRMRKTMMVHAKPVWSYLHKLDSSVSMPEAAGWGVPEGRNPWKSNEPFGDEEMQRIVANGIKRNNLFDFEPVRFSSNLVPAKPLKLPTVAAGTAGVQHGQSIQTIYTWVPQATQAIILKVTGGLIAHYRNKGNVMISLHSSQVVSEDGLHIVRTDHSVPPDGKPREVVLKTPYSGLHWIELRSGGDRASVEFTEPGRALTLESGIERPTFGPGTQWSLYFYVPKGTKLIGGYAAETSGSIVGADGNRLFAFASLGKPGYFSVPVPKGQDGRLWKFEKCQGQRLLMTMPPYLASSSDELLLPEEVVTKDSQ